MLRIVIPMKLPSLNEYINACKIQRGNWNKGNQMKQDYQKDIAVFLNKMKKYDNPIRVHFTWVEENKRRDLDNICFAKKFILDAMVNAGKLKDDNRKFVTGFTDSFEYADTAKVILDIEELENIR